MLFPEAYPTRSGEESPLFAERYELGKLLRRGPFGTTFAARDTTEEHRPCEIQILDHARDLEALRELRVQLSGLPSRHRLPLLAVGRADHKLYCEWDAIASEPLAAKLERTRPLSTNHAVEITRQILEGLTEAHGRGVPHGSLNLNSVLLEHEPGWTEVTAYATSVRLADFGLRTLGGNPLVLEFAGDGDPFSDDRLAVMRILGEMSAPRSRRVRAFLRRCERGDFPTVGFMLSAIEALQQKGRARQRLWLAVALPAALVLLFGTLFLRERSAHAASRSSAKQHAAQLAASMESRAQTQEQWDETRAALEERLEGELRRTLPQRMSKRWHELIDAPRTSQLDEVMAVARWFDDSRLETALAGYADALEQHLWQGRLADPARFEDFPNLRAWSTHIASSTALSMSEEGARILALDHGRRLTQRNETLGPLPPLLRARLPEDPGPALAEILQRSSVAASFPGPPGVLRLYRETRTSNWITEEILDARARRVTQRIHDAGGTLLEERQIDTRVSDTDSARNHVPWRVGGGWERLWVSEKPAASVPLKALGVDPIRYRHFRRAIEGRTLEVLRTEVEGANNTTLLLSPELGEVRREGNLERELVFADLLP